MTERMKDPATLPYAPPFDGTDGLPIIGGAAVKVRLQRCTITNADCDDVERVRRLIGAVACPCVPCTALREASR